MAMRLHHLNCTSTCPLGGRLMDGRTNGSAPWNAPMAARWRSSAATIRMNSNDWRAARSTPLR